MLLPHVLAAAGHLGGAGEQPGPGQTMADGSWLLARAGTFLQVHARPADAKPLLERVLAIAEATNGPDHPDVATGLNNLASILQDLGQAGTARPLMKRALTIKQAWPSGSWC